MEWRERKRKKDNPQADRMIRVPVDEQCCGRHLVCERESLLTSKPEIVYYDDEELDRLSGMSPDDYTSKDLDELSDVFSTLQPADVAGWLRSLQLRNIALPDELKDEALMIVAERRATSAQSR
ncbi:MAG: phospholipase [Paludibacteraceae bacterium]|nr:phospholipase [Paludibacteraceae bacterium]